jgi:prepilin-type N-terminal cleavage/methylation domain-containing protein
MSPASSPHRRAAVGFTMIEVLVVVAIIGIFLVVSIPSVLDTMAVRNLENKTREVQTFLQMTKLRAVNTKIIHRVRFYQPEGTFWSYEMERLQPDGTWVRVGGAPARTIPASLTVTISLPRDGTDFVAIFSPVGSMANFAANQNTIILRNPKLDVPDQMDERVLSLYLGGSIQYSKRKSS